MIGATSFIRLVFVSVIERSCNYYKQSLISIIIQCKYKMNEQTRYDETKSALCYIGIYTLYHENLISSSALQFLINIQSLQ